MKQHIELYTWNELNRLKQIDGNYRDKKHVVKIGQLEVNRQRPPLITAVNTVTGDSFDVDYNRKDINVSVLIVSALKHESSVFVSVSTYETLEKKGIPVLQVQVELNGSTKLLFSNGEELVSTIQVEKENEASALVKFESLINIC